MQATLLGEKILKIRENSGATYGSRGEGERALHGQITRQDWHARTKQLAWTGEVRDVVGSGALTGRCWPATRDRAASVKCRGAA